MPDTLPWLLTYTLAPVAAIVLGGGAAVARPQGETRTSTMIRKMGTFMPYSGQMTRPTILPPPLC